MNNIINKSKLFISSSKVHVVLIIAFLITQSFTNAQIIILRYTTLTGSHTFEQGIGAYDPNVTVRIENAIIIFMQGMDIEYAHLSVRNSQLYFYNGYGLTISRNTVFTASNDCRFQAEMIREVFHSGNVGHISLIVDLKMCRSV